MLYSLVPVVQSSSDTNFGDDDEWDDSCELLLGPLWYNLIAQLCGTLLSLIVELCVVGAAVPGAVSWYRQAFVEHLVPDVHQAPPSVRVSVHKCLFSLCPCHSCTHTCLPVRFDSATVHPVLNLIQCDSCTMIFFFFFLRFNCIKNHILLKSQVLF